MDDAKISVPALLDLMDRLREAPVDARDWFNATRAVVMWAADQGFLTGPEPAVGGVGQERFDQMAAIAAQALELVRDLRHELREAKGGPPMVRAVFGSQVSIDPEAEAAGDNHPAGPQASSGKPDPKAAGDLNAVADRPETQAKPREGAEGGSLPADDAPVPPAAGGGTSSPGDSTPVAGAAASDPPAPKRALAPLWTTKEDERAIALRLRGRKVREIAAELGRPEQATAFRIHKVLKDRIEARRQTAQTAQTVACAAAAPPFDPSRPVWWKKAQAYLNALGYRWPWSADLDLQLAEEILRGVKLDVLAADMTIDPVSLNSRWRALLAAVGTPEGRRATIEEQTHLLEILRARAGPKAQAAE